MKAEASLLPCPFCDSKPTLHKNGGNFSDNEWVVECTSNRCPVNPATYPFTVSGNERGKAGAIKSWNGKRKARENITTPTKESE